MQQADNFQETKLKMHVAAGNAKLLLDHGDSKYADDVIRHWQIGLGSNARALHFCTGATPTDLQELLAIIVKLVKGEEAACPIISFDETPY